MGKMMKAASANINIASTSQFPECGSFIELPALPTGISDRSVSPSLSSSPAGPSFATVNERKFASQLLFYVRTFNFKMLTTPTANKSQKLWPSLSDSGHSTSSSFFGDQKMITVTGNKTTMPQFKEAVSDEDDGVADDDEVDCKVPTYKNQLGDCLANALAKSVNLKDAPKSGNKKKAKKTLLFASGMNFN